MEAVCGAMELFQGLTYEVVGENTVDAYTTYRVYAQFEPGSGVDMTALYGNAGAPVDHDYGYLLPTSVGRRLWWKHQPWILLVLP